MSLDPKKIEVLKVWYSIFCTIIDDKELSNDKILDKLFKLRQLLIQQDPDLEDVIKQMKN